MPAAGRVPQSIYSITQTLQIYAFIDWQEAEAQAFLSANPKSDEAHRHPTDRLFFTGISKWAFSICHFGWQGYPAAKGLR
jgi:hypothetical protein